MSSSNSPLKSRIERSVYPFNSPHRKELQDQVKIVKLKEQSDELINNFRKEYLEDAKQIQIQGQVYEGYTNEVEQRDGVGMMKYNNGDVYIGEWKYDQMNGEGAFIFQNGERYEGRFNANMK